MPYAEPKTLWEGGIIRQNWEKDWEKPEIGGYRHGVQRSKISLSTQKTHTAPKSSSKREEPPPRPSPVTDLLEKEYQKWRRETKMPTGFQRAVDGLRKAEKAATFEKAILASAAAATSAPSEQQEELAAAAGAKFLEARNVTSMEKMKRTLVDGDKLIEVVGYIGITKPKEKKQG